jgi:hypothetical protein
MQSPLTVYQLELVPAHDAIDTVESRRDGKILQQPIVFPYTGSPNRRA